MAALRAAGVLEAIKDSLRNDRLQFEYWFTTCPEMEERLVSWALVATEIYCYDCIDAAI